MRVKVSTASLEELFHALSLKYSDWAELSKEHGVSVRTLHDWRKGKSTIPFSTFKIFLSKAGFEEKRLSYVLLNDYWHIKEASRKGALSRLKLHGDLGTKEGRRKGGLNSLLTHQQNKTGFRVLKAIVNPSKSVDLAELLGIMIGDGHLSVYQVSVTTNSITDLEHAEFVKKLFVKLFSLPVSISEKRFENAVNVVVSSKNLVGFLHSCGMPIGNKIDNGLAVPIWIFKNIQFQKAFIRGLFDTDGCIYLDKHKIKNKIYNHVGWTITSYASKLREGIIAILVNLDFSPTHTSSQKSVFLRRQGEIKRYFSEIGSHNPKHLIRYKKFVGEVA